jgi:hypothetical protein
MPPPPGEGTGSCSLSDIESVNDVNQNIVGQTAKPIFSNDLHLSWKQIRVYF